MAMAKSKRERSVRDMLAGTRLASGTTPEEVSGTGTPESRAEKDSEECSPVTKGFLTSLFDSLRGDIQELRRDISQEVRELRGEVSSLGEHVSQLEDNEIPRGEGVAGLQQEVVRLREQQDLLQMVVEDLENRSRRQNIRIRGAPVGAEKEDIGAYVVDLFRSLLGPEETQEVVLDRVHRVGRAGSPGRPSDILACLHNFVLKEKILQRARNLQHVALRGHDLQLFHDLSAEPAAAERV
ncbi:hypothetical protein NDU88_007128 [Pleurodeles waltl]|uniref:Uncharacterized protein n=1 Tax=Pleurodeles waltl TaxID=8319 RepID=A0AAV7MH21_PLEWA|nr:hypothetical protein NDU88_007128 [Pleurodeles waltl]